ncbi:hypothetical protein R3W88_005177 [Solanum pinnatisectum]|uniref:RNase H type-1 domain-containing protein n=1 Tax=Solanum pinnatisectum TaxID=50273 RepID=A0AAV9KBE8_9SOLN|nr:hypothetical protein R3W88_005177 [Solanum pinnatisectum]
MEFQWNQLCEEVERLRPKVIIRLVTWNMPQTGKIKINTDGRYLEQTGKAGIGSVARNDAGNFLFAFASPIQCNNHHVAEAIASKHAGKWLKDNGLRQDTIELDSMIMVDTLRSKNTSNPTLNPITEDIFALVDHTEATLLIAIGIPIRS